MQQRNKVIGVFSHVDAGKTTLIEALLYQAQVISAVGNVNKGTTFMDNEPIERQRGLLFRVSLSILNITVKGTRLLIHRGTWI